MSDRYDEKLFLGFIEGDLSPAERLRFERQLAVDPTLRQLVEQVQLDRQELRQTPLEPAPPEIMETVNQALERAMLFDEPAAARGDQAWRQRRLRLVRWSAYAAVAALALVSTGVVVHTLLQDQLPNSGPRPPVGPVASVKHSPGISDPAQVMDLLSAGQGELGSGGQYAVLLADAEHQDKALTGTTGAGGRAGAGALTATPMASATPAPAAGPALHGFGGTLNARLDESKQDEDPAKAREASDRLKLEGSNDSRAALAQKAQGSLTLVAGFANYASTGNISNQRIEVVARNTRQTQTNLALWCINNGSTLVAPVGLDNSIALNVGNTFNGNNSNNNSNNNGNNLDDNSNAMNSNALPLPGRFNNGLTNNSSGQGQFSNAAGNPVRLMVVVPPEKVAELVQYMNARGDRANLTVTEAADLGQSGGQQAGGGALARRDLNAKASADEAAAATPVSPLAAPVVATGVRPETTAAPTAPSAAAPAPGLARSAPGVEGKMDQALAERTQGPTGPTENREAPRLRRAPTDLAAVEEKFAKDNRPVHQAAPAETQFKLAISGAQVAFPATSPAQVQSRLAAVPASLQQTNWSAILDEQLPHSAALELHDTPSSVEVPVVIVEEADKAAK